MYSLKQLRRLRLFVFITVLTGIGVSLAINVLHAPETFWARSVSTVPPLAVFGALELIVRIPSSKKSLSVVRVLGATLVALGAMAISYWQQRSAVQELGFEAWEAYIFPVIIDGFMMVASVSLFEVAGKIRQLVADEAEQPTSSTATRAANDRLESPATLAYRTAARELAKQSRIAALNGTPVVVESVEAEQSA